jgi:hypothetical protein
LSVGDIRIKIITDFITELKLLPMALPTFNTMIICLQILLNGTVDVPSNALAIGVPPHTAAPTAIACVDLADLGFPKKCGFSGFSGCEPQRTK